ncbi:hypothetical protein GQ43DRAFT_471647 [Delitschia confertaspora ATCC 74209]|uniref:AMP-dependent synthetase/ligase domain-containing protein n=1 Tax=Delitschia confertaspora ATCC 74209 TaxID=1513339 RepID=A0A9P4JS68_9PLEO|nr:hypothetical protein GQ43DRAFT_471647 [Delitschia confertaspora ATCC 74209]
MSTGDNTPYGKRLIPSFIDEVSQSNPQRICFSFPKSTNLADGFRDLTFRTFTNAVDKTAHFIQKEVGRSSVFETIMYMGYPDVRYYIVLVACMKTGHKVLFSSPHHTLADHARLVRKTNCVILIHTSGFPVSGILETCKMESLVMPELDYLLGDATPCSPYPYRYSYEEARYHPVMVVCTSGEGKPEAVVWPHEVFLAMDAQQLVEPLDDWAVLWKTVSSGVRRSFNALPMFNGESLALGITRVLFTNTVIVLGPPGDCTADSFDQVLRNGNIDAAECSSATLSEVAKRPDIIAKLGKLKHITYVGDPLPKSPGDLISQHTALYSLLSTPKLPFLVQHTSARKDWAYVFLNPVRNSISFRPLSPNATSTLYELVIIRSAPRSEPPSRSATRSPALSPFQVASNRSATHSPAPSPFQVAVRTSAPPSPRLGWEKVECPTGELFSPHPDARKPNHWRYEGRIK